MNVYQKIKSFLFFDTYGAISIANFLICAVSGIFLAIPYDVNNPYDSISLIMISNPMGSLLRNVHYWSAQFFLIFSLLHLWEYFKADKDFRLKKSVWIRVVISIVFIFYVMLSGFILKADVDSLQARRIIEALILGIPLIGDLLNYLFIGPEGNFQILYVHHIATASIFIAIITFEHARTIWAKLSTLFAGLFIALFFSFLFTAPLHDGLDSIIKGPWYFVGFQEILHWLTRPAYSLLFILILLIIIYYFPYIKKSRAQITRKIFFVLFLAYLILTIIGYFFRGENWQWRWEFWEAKTPFTHSVLKSDPILNEISQIPQALNKRESCLLCHDGIQGFSPAHDPNAIGCISCHQGNPFSVDKDQSHQGMILIPGNLADANRSCGTADCHPDISNRIHKSIMSTMSGVVSVDRFVFGELELPDGHFHIKDLKQTAADNHLRDLCAACHLGNQKTETGEITQLSRGGGCNACHLNYSEEALGELNALKISKPDSIKYKYHPSLSLNITDDHCFGCHSRSGRISTNYKGWHETQLEETNVIGNDKYVVLEDKRIFEKIYPDVHHQSGMLCVDCHTSYETMGDGTLHAHKESQMQVACEDCHFEDPAKTIHKSDLDFENQKIIETRKYNQKYFLTIAKSGKALPNTFIDETGKAKLISKSTGEYFPLNPPVKACTKGNSHDELSCGSCHTSWVPQCIGCHNAFENETETYDLLDNKMIKGAWIEYAGYYFADPPTLGIEQIEDQQKRVLTFVPGMTLSIDKGSYTGEKEEIFHRLYAPASGHTTMAKGRSCMSCHNDPLAIGYGRGTLEYQIADGKGRWGFKQRFANNKHDGLPEDAWIGFLEETNELRATRTNMRPFTLDEQKNILTVGACLTCHKDDSKVMQQSLEDFQKLLAEMTDKCILPDWND